DVVAVERPGWASDLDRLRVVPQLIVSGRQPGEPDEQSWVSRAKLHTFLNALHSGPRFAQKGKHDLEHRMRRRKARIEFDGFFQFGCCALGSACPHANQGQREVRIWVAPIERNGPLSEFESLRIISIGILGPAQIRRDGQRYGEGCRCLWGLRILQKRAAE